jgi:hypothetical protein
MWSLPFCISLLLRPEGLLAIGCRIRCQKLTFRRKRESHLQTGLPVLVNELNHFTKLILAPSQMLGSTGSEGTTSLALKSVS